MTTTTETRRFEAETRQLLDLMVHSLYQTKEVFLRELISNASDALDKLRLEVAQKSELARYQKDPEIRLEVDPEARTLRVRDNGIGMSREEVVENIGTIARSGTAQMLEALRASKSLEGAENLIGQFGVGFYSCFMVSDRVVLTTRRAGEDVATRWEYAGEGEYTLSAIDEAEAAELPVGTAITLHLKPSDAEEGLEDYTEEWVLRRIVRRYSDFVRYPIKLVKPAEDEGESAEESEEKPAEEAAAEAGEEAGEEAAGKSGKGFEETVLNSMKAIWLRPESEVSEDDYKAFYRHISHDWGDPLERIAMRAEGRLEYQALLFIPERAPADIFTHEHRRGLQLYVRNVMIMESCEELLPPHLRFVRGVVDAQDLPLNVSREVLQDSRQVAQIRRALTRKVHDTLATMKSKETERFHAFWAELGAVLKEGLATDPSNKEKLVPLLVFHSTKSGDTPTDLAGYLERMKEGQEAIWYITGTERERLLRSPQLEALVGRDEEVLLLTDPVDEFMLAHLTEYEGKPLRSASKGAAEAASEEEKAKVEAKKKTSEGLLDKLQKALDEHVSEVRFTTRLTNSPACLVSEEGAMSPHIERLMRLNKLEVPAQKRILELNPNHEIVERLTTRHEIDASAVDAGEAGELLYGQALLAEGSPLPDPGRFAELLAKLMLRAM